MVFLHKHHKTHQASVFVVHDFDHRCLVVFLYQLKGTTGFGISSLVGLQRVGVVVVVVVVVVVMVVVGTDDVVCLFPRMVWLALQVVSVATQGCS